MPIITRVVTARDQADALSRILPDQYVGSTQRECLRRTLE